MTTEGGILITGGCGFIGKKLARQLRHAGRKVRILDSLSPQIHGPAPDLGWVSAAGIELIRGSVSNPDHCRQAVAGVATVVHLASETGTGQSMYEIRQYMETNVTGTAAMIEASIQAGVGRFVLSSSRAIYGEGTWECATCGPVHASAREHIPGSVSNWNPVCPACRQPLARLLPTPESESADPTSIYGVSKLAQEQLVRVACRSSKMTPAILRFFNVYGAGQSLSNPYTGVLGVFTNRASSGAPLDLYEDGEILRDFVHVDDVVTALLAAVDHAAPVVANIGSGDVITIRELAVAVIRACASQSETRVTGKTRLGDIRGGLADIRAAKATLGWEPAVRFEDGLRGYLEWALSQPFEDRYAASLEELKKAGIYT